MYCELGRNFNEHTKRSETKRGSDVESQMSEVGKQLCSENHWDLWKMYTHEVTIFRKSNSRRFICYKFFFYSLFLTAAKIELQNMFIFTLNLHQESLNAPYSIWYDWKDKFLLFKTVYHLIRKRVLVRVPVQWKLETPQILLSARVVWSLKSATIWAMQKMLTLEELEKKKRGKFFYFSDN